MLFADGVTNEDLYEAVDEAKDIQTSMRVNEVNNRFIRVIDN